MTAVIKIEHLDREQSHLLAGLLGVDPKTIGNLDDEAMEINIAGDKAFIFYRALATTSADAVRKFLGEAQ